MTEDELVEAVRRSIAGLDVPPPATHEAIAEAEAACGYPLPPLLVRLLTEVANGGFGPRNAAYGVRGHNWHSAEIFPDMTEAALAAIDDPEWSQRRWCLPLIDWGCGMMTLIDCREPSGPLWGWDTELFPLNQNLAEMLEHVLTTKDDRPFAGSSLPDQTTDSR